MDRSVWSTQRPYSMETVLLITRKVSRVKKRQKLDICNHQLWESGVYFRENVFEGHCPIYAAIHKIILS